MWFYHSKLRLIKEDADFPFFFVIFVLTWEIFVYKNLFCVKKTTEKPRRTELPNKIMSHYAFAVAKGRLKVTKQMKIMVIIDDILLVTKYLVF